MSHGLLADSVDTTLDLVYYIVVQQMPCSVKCTIAVSKPRKTCVRCLSAVAELLVFFYLLNSGQFVCVFGVFSPVCFELSVQCK